MISHLVTLWCGLAGGATVGGIVGFARGKSDGISIGRVREHQEAEVWREVTTTSGYAQLMPHGDAGHQCTSACYR